MKASELIVAEISTDELVRLADICRNEGVSVSQKLTELIKIFLAEGDNHQLKTA